MIGIGVNGVESRRQQEEPRADAAQYTFIQGGKRESK
jgi:hypothetical protein